MNKPNVISVKMWGTTIGYLYQDGMGPVAFQYDEDFLRSGIEVAPLKMPLSKRTYTFPDLPEKTFHGLPGLVADSLPDKFGNMVIKRFLERQGRSTDELTIIERLCYTGKRGMGALEYAPAVEMWAEDDKINLDALTKMAADILEEKEEFHVRGADNDKMIAQLMESASSVGGARAKTLIAWNPATNDIRSGQVAAGEGYEYWLLKFGSIPNNKDKDSSPDQCDYAKVEYAYYLMATAAGINMSECRLLESNGVFHFMTKRFDRADRTGEKLHMQSLCAIAHMDFNSAREYSYEEAFIVMKKLGLPYSDVLQLFKRMVFSDKAKNYDDHTKNIAYIMDKDGIWRLSPAFDMTYAHKKNGEWTHSHQMLINGKAGDILESDLLAVANNAGIRKKDAELVIRQVKEVVSRWEYFASQANVPAETISAIRADIDGN